MMAGVSVRTTAVSLSLALAAAGCGSHRATTTAPTSPVLGGSPEHVTFAAVRTAVDGVYRAHPAIVAYDVRDVTYSPKTRDRVLAVCRRGGGTAATKRDLEASRIAACAPLIFFFYRYGRQAGAADSTDLARRLYWYAATNVKGPFDARASLDALLSTWGVK
jgi:hypothetical protein